MIKSSLINLKQLQNVQLNLYIQQILQIDNQYQMEDDELNFAEDQNNCYDDYNNYDDYPNDYQENETSELQYINEEQHYQIQKYDILPISRLYDELQRELDQVDVVVSLGRGWSLLLLKTFNWNKQYLKQQYYNNVQGNLQKIGYSTKYSNEAQTRRNKYGICEICLSEDIELFFNICNHNFCGDCWEGHIRSTIESGNPFAKCMADGCSAPVLSQTAILFLKLNKEYELSLAKYQKKICEMFVTNNHNYQFCTGADCYYYIKASGKNIGLVTCKCEKSFCFLCQSDDHYPCNCQERKKWSDQTLKEEADAKWIANNTKLCPFCKKAVERSAGCNYMACRCGKAFCYMCSRPWQPDHKDHFNCHIYKKSSDQVINRQKEVLQKMSHSVERYAFNHGVANFYRGINNFPRQQMLFKVLKINLIDSDFINSAHKFAIECCDKLKWIYAWIYFNGMQEQKAMKQKFDFALGEYQKYKQNLLKMLAVDLKKYITAVEQEKQWDEQKRRKSCQEFKSLKESIVNYYTCTKSYKEKFVNQFQRLKEELETIKYGLPLELQLKKSTSKAQNKKNNRHSIKNQSIPKSQIQKEVKTEQVNQQKKVSKVGKLLSYIGF